jgi:hypothetical protein
VKYKSSDSERSDRTSDKGEQTVEDTITEQEASSPEELLESAGNGS